MTSWSALPLLLPAALVMASFALIPRRLWFVQLPAVIGWAVVWTDNRLTADWPDVAGLAVVGACGVVLGVRWSREGGSRRPPPGPARG